MSDREKPITNAEIHPRVKEIFIAGLAIGFVEALKTVRDAK